MASAPRKILFINPNSSESITANLVPLIPPAPGFDLEFYTGPAGAAPAQIDSLTTGIQSAAACYSDLCARGKLDPAAGISGYVVGCYSDHQLVGMLREHFAAAAAVAAPGAPAVVPVVGIFQASVVQALALGRRFAILTTARAWEEMLDTAVYNFLGAATRDHAYVGTYSTGLGVLEIHALDHDEVVARLVACAERAVARGATALVLGCAGLSGLDTAIKQAVGRHIVVIDSVVAGIEVAKGLVASDF
ncbi:hypothetical protein DV451_000492 [Geotrichum candidum]|uniref:Asp/Glu/hydantoin racemase n=1 Tax=Geotrichum candidum TaxID=1173061 RepID=A0A9P5G9J2_GEOCN|nr:hypothetical protein DV451_000492 [Geotrichum candidum]KAF5111384.1 hypothetical protein DV453_000029 [Geotrichum candidum]